MAHGKQRTRVVLSYPDQVYTPSRHIALEASLIPTELAAYVLTRDGSCHACHTTDNLTVHHMLPPHRDGPTVAGNLLTLCSRCHDEIELQDYDSRVETLHHTPMWFSLQFSDNDGDSWLGNPLDWHTWVYGGGQFPGP